MKVLHLIFILFFLHGLGMAQAPSHDYFPRSLCQTERVRSITVYETKIDNPVAQAGHANRIRLARNIVRQHTYDSTGLHVSTNFYIRGGDKVHQTVEFTYDAQGRKTAESVATYHTNSADSTKSIMQRRSWLHYDEKGRLTSTARALVSPDKRQPIDSTYLRYDAQGRLLSETTVSLDPSDPRQLAVHYEYAANAVDVTTVIADANGNHDHYTTDAKGRLFTVANYAPTDTVPRLRATYQYDPRGWLQEITYAPDWRFFPRGETIISRKNKYDDHGKLVETQLDYGDGKRQIEFYEYSYYVAE